MFFFVLEVERECKGVVGLGVVFYVRKVVFCVIVKFRVECMRTI